MAVRTREVAEADREAVARLHWEVRRRAFADCVPAAILDRKDLSYRRRYWAEILADPLYGSGRFALLVEDEGTLAGIAGAGPPEREEFPGWTAVLHNLYVLPAFQGRGHGRRLLEACGTRFAARGEERFYLWTPEGNLAARGFYGKLGGREIGSDERVFLEGTVRRIAYGFTCPRPSGRARRGAAPRAG